MLSPPCALEVELINGDCGYSDRVLWPTNYKRVSAMRMILPVGENHRRIMHLLIVIMLRTSGISIWAFVT